MLVTTWSLLRFAHVLAAMVWVGGQLVLSLLLLPVLRRRLPMAQRREVTRELGRWFGLFTLVVFLPVQVVTGLALGTLRGVRWADLTADPYGRTLLAKLVLLAIVLVLSGLHGLAIGRARAVAARALAVATLLGSVGIVVLATALVG